MRAQIAVDSEPLTVHHGSGGGPGMEHRIVYGVAFDAVRQRVLFCGLEGKLSFLELNNRRTGTLLVPPGRVPFIQLALTPDRSAVVATAHRIDFESNKPMPSHFQIWSYPALR